ncbi:MAG: glycosyltransferase [Chloroflexi bacterium]|nr:glycosyltransferase [Chloroflexota bacterium]
MRIAIVSTYPPGKGSLNEYAFHFVRHLRQKAEVSEVIMLVDELPPGDQYQFEDAPVPVKVEVCWRFGALDNALRIRRAVKQHQPDIVFFNLQFATFGGSPVAASLGLLAAPLVRLSGVPAAVLLHNITETVDLKSAGFGDNPIKAALIRIFGTVFTRFLLTSNLIAVTIPLYVDILEKKYGAPNVFLAPHGVFEETPEPDFNLPPGAAQIMTFGKFGTYKRVDMLIEAFRGLRRQAKQPLELVIAGTDSPNAAGYLESMRQQYADVPDVRYTGYVAEDDVPRIFNEAAVVVFPYSSTTGSSGVLHQAGSYGKAAVLPNIGDFAHLVTEEGYRAEFFQPEDVASLETAIARIIDDPDHRRELGLANYAAARGIPMRDVVDWYLLHFEQLIKQGAK